MRSRRQDFDDSIIPGEVASVSASKRAAPRCGICGEEGHRRDRCKQKCQYCGAQGAHLSDDCPTMDENWRRLKKPGRNFCRCDATKVCWACKNLCCSEACVPKKDDLLVRGLHTVCKEHGTKKYEPQGYAGDIGACFICGSLYEDCTCGW
jgi:hypothetical protein